MNLAGRPGIAQPGMLCCYEFDLLRIAESGIRLKFVLAFVLALSGNTGGLAAGELPHRRVVYQYNRM
ncbi:hypothetical protein SBA3_3020010 [Candidatus Sulfopaludibacter sp. SbA3]|nr:hypothetical protein SBA3_3020010 [Candidatus Sulfopaludibacter sp. SbA3]